MLESIDIGISTESNPTYSYTNRVTFASYDDLKITLVPTSTTVNPTAMLMGYMVGQAIKINRAFPKREPVAYSYNGVDLPALPQWDKEKFPYACIGYLYKNLSYHDDIYLFVGTEKFVCDADNLVSAQYIDSEWVPTKYYIYKLSSSGLAWEWFTDPDYRMITPFWANHDVTQKGTVFLAASEPVPVYE